MLCLEIIKYINTLCVNQFYQKIFRDEMKILYNKYQNLKYEAKAVR